MEGKPFGEGSQIPEIQKATLLEDINKKLQELGSTARWKKTPETVPGSEVLKDKILVMVDDVVGVLQGFAPHLMVATDGKASFIHYQGQELEEMLREILGHNPNIVLLDHDLSDQLKGPEIAKALKQAGFTGDIVGFSSERYAAKEFRNTGAIGCVEKEAGDPGLSIKKLADLIVKK